MYVMFSRGHALEVLLCRLQFCSSSVVSSCVTILDGYRLHWLIHSFIDKERSCAGRPKHRKSNRKSPPKHRSS